ncbi:T9SS type A sorting domain-containing protein [Chryseobacterium sp. GMJ5]|uniref:T9SS type A sorting domain-containing protein n=1 Tax=Chryseobacterium gilvum TaxID=2976534 RepID=A0ABT2VV59_9FLAO|nr:T9SS type A sorting domain-containing protein [Chryseobacterium gilvum]MCU7613886.1 T9SS type A sorting domain-containing protein [Chryseobacterium gilvum]
MRNNLTFSLLMTAIMGMSINAQNLVKNPSFEDGPALCAPNNPGSFYIGQGYADFWTSINPADQASYPLNTARIYQNTPTCTYSQFSPGISANHGNRSISIFQSNTPILGISDSRAIGSFTTGTLGSGVYKICLAALGGIYLNEPNGRNTLQVYLVRQGTSFEKLISEFNIPKNTGSTPWGNYGNSFKIIGDEAGIYDRVVLRLKSPSNISGNYSELVYIDNVIIGPVQSTPSPCDGTYDLAAFDNNTDIGAEPYDPGSNWQVWQSNDIWNRATDANSVTGNLVAENVDNASGHNNLVRFRVRNIGVSASNESRVRLYWTIGTTGGEPWPVAWNGSTTVNLQTSLDQNNNPVYNNFTSGGQITKPYPTPNVTPPSQSSHIGNGINITQDTTYDQGGFIIPPLQPGEEYIVNTLWTPSAFNLNLLTNHPQICFLARVVDTNDPMYDERTSSASFSFSDNVRSNNNIVTRNSTFVNLTGGGVFYRGSGTIFFSNSTSEDGLFDFRIRDLSQTDVSFSQLGDVILTLDKTLFDKWVQSGSSAEGLEISDWEKHELRVTDINNAKLKNILLQAGEYRGITVSFVLTQPTNLIRNFQFIANQNRTENPDEEYGTACNFSVAVNDHEEDKGDGFYGDSGDAAAASVFGPDMKLSPNPSSDTSTLDFVLNQNTALTVEILDTFGKKVKTVTSSEKFVKGKNSIEMNISDLTIGVYRVLIYNSSERKMINLIKQ